MPVECTLKAVIPYNEYLFRVIRIVADEEGLPGIHPW